jgi:hypothetical protein
MEGIEIINLNAYTSPRIEEVKNSEFVSYGEDNDYFQYLIDRYTNSTTNQAIIKGTSTKIYGRGLSAIDSEEKPSEWLKVEGIISPKDLRKIPLDRKLLGMAAMQVTYSKGRVNKVTHFPMETLRAGKIGKSGKVEKWLYHPNWSEYKRSDELKEFPVFGTTNQKKTEIYILAPYTSGYYYYPPVDYSGALPYAYLEEVISEYLINDALNGFSGTKVINLNNGIPDKEAQRKIKHSIHSKLTGQLGDKVVISFNNNKESATTVENLPLDNAPDHYTYLSEECRNKLITGHNITSPLLLGVRDGSGFSSNADEIQNSSLFFNNTVIKVYQDEITEALSEILAVNKLDFELYFKTIQPLEFIDTENMDEETEEEATGVKDEDSKLGLSAEGFNDGEMLDALKGCTVDSEECRNKLITGHNITSPLLLGVRDGSGFSSNADEIQNSSLFFNNTVIKVYQDEITEALSEILAVNKLDFELYFKTIQPLEFIDTENMDEETEEEATGVKDEDSKLGLSAEGFNDGEMLDALKGCTVDSEEWELVDVREQDDNNDSVDAWANSLIKEKLSTMQKLKDFIKSKPIEKSALDKSFYRVRYTYQERHSSGNSREFCQKMMSRTSNGVVYRKEDIDQASFSGVNKSFGHKGQNYSLFRFKGGVNCGHYFQEELYRMKSKTERQISRGKEQSSIPKSYKPKGKQYKDSKIAPKDMPNNGHHPNYKK